MTLPFFLHIGAEAFWGKLVEADVCPKFQGLEKL
jgi:hypothetical protein